MAFSNDFQVMDAGRYNVTAVNIGGFDSDDQKPLFCVPPHTAGIKGVTIVDIVLVSDSTTSGSSLTDNYAFQIKDLTNSVSLISAAVSTSDTEITKDKAYHITPDQNNENLGAATVLELNITATDGGLLTDLSSAEVTAYVLWRWEV